MHKHKNKDTQHTKLKRSIQNSQPYIQLHTIEPKGYERTYITIRMHKQKNKKKQYTNLMFVEPCIIVIVEE